ncbi:uncharacterized protein LOC142533119 [Primulina tabacum]|uniref:uncharacterized protein LOC142533119 n=1 Tax=Primulina tabacum TaxID=48773 RepID=UPI003F593167
MGTIQPTTKGNKNTNSSRRGGGGRLFSFGPCFGLSSPKKQHKKNFYHDSVPSAAAAHAQGDGVESVKYGSKKPDFSKSDIPTSESIKEIQIIADTAAAAEAPPPLIHLLNNKIDQELITVEKNYKNQQEQSIPTKVQETSSNPMIKLRQSVSLPALHARPQRRLNKGKTAAAATGEGGNGGEMTAAAGKVDSMVGASIIALTLVVMLIWGKVCAILCSAAWVFLVHCFKQSNESFENKNDVVSSDHQILVLDSHEYKKRVVLQGFLERIR